VNALPPVLAPVRATSPEPRVVGDALFRALERPFVAADRWIDRALPEDLNPLARTGAVANATFAIAMVTGVALLLWYVPSVHQAHSSVDGMADKPLTAGLMRSLHRYSSDACIFFMTVHAAKLVFARRFGGARWLAWVTGLVVVGVLWLTGWTGYWLVWDERARQVALVSAKALDVLPIFIDPLSRGFLYDAGVNSLLFFVVFFIHMIVPAMAVIGLWLHITRLRRANWLPTRAMWGWICGSLLVLSLVLPADTAEAARMAVEPESFAMDWWYLAPLLIAERLTGGAAWGWMLLVSVVVGSVPWTLSRQRAAVAAVEEKRCNSCGKCEADCPYAAISMAPRTDGKDFPFVALVDPSLCVGCGICAGSCDSAGVGTRLAPDLNSRRTVEGWFAAGGMEGLLVLCAEGAGDGLEVRDDGVCRDLPGWRVLPVPCAGSVHPYLIERALRAGATQAVIASCGPGNCHFREGALWAELRMAAKREPALREEKVDLNAVSVLRLGRGADLMKALQAERRTVRRGGPFVAAGLWAIFMIIVGAFSVGPWWTAASPEPQLVVTLKHPGQVGEECRQLTAEEKAELPIHMRRDQECERRRADVHIQVDVDGTQVLDATYPPAGLWGDGNSIALETLPVSEGSHRVSVRLADGLDADAWGWSAEETLDFRPRERRILTFGRNDGFVWH
jgi:ferredoxin